MTTDLEKRFFDTFGIEPHYYCADEYVFEAMLEYECTEGNRKKCKTCKKVGKSYPQISDRILLELICVINRFDIYFDYYYQEEYQVLRETILEDSINLNCKLKQTDFSKLKHQIQALFKEG